MLGNYQQVTGFGHKAFLVDLGGRMLLLGKVARGVRRYFGNILKHSPFSFLLIPSQFSSPETFICIRKSHRSRRHSFFLYLAMCSGPGLSSGDEKTQFQPLKTSEVCGDTHV